MALSTKNRRTEKRKVVEKLQDYGVFIFAFLPVMIASSVAQAANLIG